MLEKIVAVIAIVAAVAFALMNHFAQKDVSTLTERLGVTEKRLETSESNLAVMTKARDQAIQASAILQDHLDRTAADAEHWQQVVNDLEEKDGADEALNDYERAVLDSLLAP